jgi:O-methyltransferase
VIALSDLTARLQLKERVRRALDQLGYELKRKGSEFAGEDLSIVERVRGFTATGPERVLGLVGAVRYLVQNQLPGAFVECGVWRGGSMMAAAWTLAELGDTARELYLFDTFEGMSAPTTHDRLMNGAAASEILAGLPRGDTNFWCIAGLEEVKANLRSTGYPEQRLHFVKGKVEDTLPSEAPSQIALLRLDTDWYESTRHELEQLYDRLVPNGVLIIDDYGTWQGARKAVDEFFAQRAEKPLLVRLDATGRLAIKPA